MAFSSVFDQGGKIPEKDGLILKDNGLVVSSKWNRNSDKGLVDCECSGTRHLSLIVFVFRDLLYL